MDHRSRSEIIDHTSRLTTALAPMSRRQYPERYFLSSQEIVANVASRSIDQSTDRSSLNSCRIVRIESVTQRSDRSANGNDDRRRGDLQLAV